MIVYKIEVANSKGTSKGQEHSKTPATSLPRREGGDATPPWCTPKQLGQRVAHNVEVADSQVNILSGQQGKYTLAVIQ